MAMSVRLPPEQTKTKISKCLSLHGSLLIDLLFVPPSSKSAIVGGYTSFWEPAAERPQLGRFFVW